MDPADRDDQDAARSDHAAEMRSIAADEARFAAERDLHGYVKDAAWALTRIIAESTITRRAVDAASDTAADLNHPAAAPLVRAAAVMGTLDNLLEVVRGLLHDADQAVHS